MVALRTFFASRLLSASIVGVVGACLGYGGAVKYHNLNGGAAGLRPTAVTVEHDGVIHTGRFLFLHRGSDGDRVRERESTASYPYDSLNVRGTFNGEPVSMYFDVTPAADR